jgi:homospermidine synthase
LLHPGGLPMPVFPHRIVILGLGSVSRCALPLLFRHIEVPPDRVTVIALDLDESVAAPWAGRGVEFVRGRIAPESLDRLLGPRLSVGDLRVDLAWNIDTATILDWCHDRGGGRDPVDDSASGSGAARGR